MLGLEEADFLELLRLCSSFGCFKVKTSFIGAQHILYIVVSCLEFEGKFYELKRTRDPSSEKLIAPAKVVI